MGHGGTCTPLFRMGTGGHYRRTLTGRKLQVEPADRAEYICHDNTIIGYNDDIFPAIGKCTHECCWLEHLHH